MDENSNNSEGAKGAKDTQAEAGRRAQPKFIFVMGTTASGKSELAMELALRYGGSIVNCDSLQVYHGLDIGTAKPSLSDRQKVPHFLLSYAHYPRVMTAGEYTRDFFQLLSEQNHDEVFYVVGGTGFYFQALEKGMYPVRAAVPEIKAQVEAEMSLPGGPGRLYLELQTRDVEYSLKIHPADHYRLGRAIELLRAEGRTITDIQKEFLAKKAEFPYPLLKIAPRLGRERLAERVSLRTQMMLKTGLIEETLDALEKDWGQWAPLSAVGYREVIEYLKNLKTLEWLEQAINQSTLQLAKKQRTWFQRDLDIHWFDVEDSILELAKSSRLNSLVRLFLTNQ